mmetsp:Transcript_3110/g.9297  ORF Transcript_3110/g.9297 Transcript_3110/m.9297 type:complete len:164 (+) Transcript_3110:116-607(+)
MGGLAHGRHGCEPGLLRRFVDLRLLCFLHHERLGARRGSRARWCWLQRGLMTTIHAMAASHPAVDSVGELGAEFVCKSAGVFFTTEKWQPHRMLLVGASTAGRPPEEGGGESSIPLCVEWIVFSALAKGVSHTIGMGVNQAVCGLRCLASLALPAPRTAGRQP